MIFGWCVGILLPVFAGIFSNKNISNTACIMIGRSLSTHFALLYVCLSITFCLCIVIVYTIIIYVITSSSVLPRQGNHHTLLAVLRMGSIILTNFLASISVTTMVSMSIAQNYSSDNLEILLSFIVFPIISCVNPLISTLSTAIFLWHINALKIFNVICNTAVTKITKLFVTCRHKF